MSSSETPPFDPYTQNVTFFMADGVTQVTVSITDIDENNFYNLRTCMNYGAQLGACAIMFFVVALLTKPAKRHKPVYWLNLLSLVLGVLRALLYAWYFWSPWDEFYNYFGNDYSTVDRGSYATSVAGTVIPLCMTITVNLSLMLQARTVCRLFNRVWYLIFFGVSFLVILLAVGFRFAETVTVTRAILEATSYYNAKWIERGALICNTVAVWWFSAIFTLKLLWTLYARRAMGFAPWSPMQILMVMGGCTMLIPSIFAILEYIAPTNFPEAGSLCLTLVALLLPLSSLWASMVTTEPTSNFNVSQLFSNNSNLPSMHSVHSTRSNPNRKTFGSEASARTGPLNERKGSAAQCTMTTVDTIVEEGNNTRRDSTEMDLERMGVRIDHSYSIHSEK